MATAWKVAAATAVVGWFVSPIIAFFLPKILSPLGFDATKKLRQLELTILHDLEETLPALDQARMLGRVKKSVSEVASLDKMAAMLRRARDEAEDILDDHQAIELYRNSAAATCLAGCNRICVWIVATLRSRSARLLQWAPNWRVPATCCNRMLWIAGIIRSRTAWLLQWTGNWFKERVPANADQAASRERVLANEKQAASHEHVLNIPVTPHTDSASKEQALVPVAPPADSDSKEQAPVPAPPTNSATNGPALVPVVTPAESASDEGAVSEPTPSEPASHEEAVSEATPAEPASVLMTAHSCSSLDVFKNLCRFVFYWLLDTYQKACSHRDLSYAGAGITSNQDALDCVLTAISRLNLKKRIEEIESTVNEVKKSVGSSVTSKNMLDDIANKNRRKIRNASTHEVFGREGLRDCIMAKLRETPSDDVSSSSTSPCYSVIGIYGVAGSGKTTFARYTRDYIEKECKEEKLFDTIMCIHVSETFSVKDIFHEMLKDITKNRHSNISDREELEEKLKESLRGKRFFLILDDLWVKTKNDQQLEELISPLNVGLEGSKILVTARTKVAAGALCADEPMEMPDLNEDDYLRMFMHHSLGGTSVAHEEFKRVGRVIAGKLHGSPIAAVVVGGQLGTKRDIKFWKNIAERDMLNGTMDALWWSYQQLSPNIRRCFEYCNILPRRIASKKDDLVRLWIAQGFVNTSCTTKEMEAVAEGYIQELVSCSFMQQEKPWDDDDDDDRFRIHDLMHDLVDMVTGSDYFRIENEWSQRGECWEDVPRDVRHLFVQKYDAKLITKNKILGFVNLRTLMIDVVEDGTLVEEKVIESICKRLPKLRVLAVAFSQERDPIGKPNEFSFPESIGQLKHLRYLAFKTLHSWNITLPGTLNKLQHIQLLDFGLSHISRFNFAELVNLRHIFCCTQVKLPYVGRLSSLQTLSGFKVSNEQGCELKQLRDLNKLRGKLEISGLENVKSKAQALEANLAAKQLTALSLYWGDDDDRRCNPEVEADVLEGLCPPVGLKTLALGNFVGWRYTDWMVGKFAEAFCHLHVLHLLCCNWDALPGNMEHLISLKELCISHCENIRSLPSLPQSLKRLILHGGNDEFMESCQTVGHPNWQKIEHIPRKIIF